MIPQARFRLAALVAVVVCLPACSDAPSGRIDAWAERASRKLMPDVLRDPAHGSADEVVLEAARGEWAPFQIVARSRDAGQPLDDVDVAVSDLSGPSGASIPAAEIRRCREYFIAIDRPSPGGVPGNEREPGEYPDPLIPFTDPYGDAAVGAPFSVPAGRSQPVFVDIHVPPGTPPGDYTGSAVVSARGEPSQTIPIALHVWPFELPGERSVSTAYHLGRSAIRSYHGGPDRDRARQQLIFERYERTLHEHRIDTLLPYQGADDPLVAEPDGSLATPDWSEFDAAIGPRLDGSYYADGVPQRRFNFGLFKPGAEDGLETDLSDEAYVQAAAEAARHLRARGWFDRVYVYVFDEPYLHAGAYERIAHDVELMIQGDPAWRGHFLVTNHFVPELDGSIDIWVPDTKNYDSWMWGEGTLPGRDFYAARRAAGQELWFYNCLCTFPPYAGYDIDTRLGHEPRILMWGDFYEGATGHLYWSTDFWVPEDPWDAPINRSSFPLGARAGDGFLLYPGDHDGSLAPAGSPTDVRIDGPVVSHRLKMIREGLEDWEYFILASRIVGADEVRHRMARAYTRLGVDPGSTAGELSVLIDFTRSVLGLERRDPPFAYDEASPPWTLDDATIDQVRHEIGELIAEASQPTRNGVGRKP